MAHKTDEIEKAVDGLVAEQTPADQANVVRTDTVFVAPLSQVLAGVDFDLSDVRSPTWVDLDLALMDRDRFVDVFLERMVDEKDYERASALVRRRIGEDVYVNFEA